MKALLDTSFFVATESGRPLGEMPGVTETEVSVVTLAELTLGVLMANDSDRAKRVATFRRSSRPGTRFLSMQKWQGRSRTSWRA